MGSGKEVGDIESLRILSQGCRELPGAENFIKFTFCFRLFGWQDESSIKSGRLEAENQSNFSCHWEKVVAKGPAAAGRVTYS